MSPTPILLIASVFLFGADPLQPPGRRAVQPGVARPIRVRPAVATPFQLRVQKTSRFPKAPRPAASKPATSNGLAVTIQPEKKEFAGNGPLAFEVVLTNQSKKPIALHSPNGLGSMPKLVVSNQANANQWSIAGKLKHQPQLSTLAPGKSLTLTVVVESQFIAPVPFPRPIPRPNVRGVKAAQPIENGKRIRIGRPIRPPIVAVPVLPCGQGKCRARLFLEFAANPEKGQPAVPYWSGKLASSTVEFSVGKPQPIVAPGGPTTKEQAIRVAHPVAERALQGHYKPVANLRPARIGPWIESPEKTATVKKSASGWTVSWTSFPAKGHGHNVTIDVGRNGSAVVREVFTSYSKR